ncbi:STAS domain-containing protein [Schlesneria sp. T3-172]|uniref:STAS domain-containing protein n=1 Tax=Schlesneria TaxID=656899 RepID=UPI002EFA28B8
MGSDVSFQSEIIDGDILAIVLRGDLDSISTPEFERQLQTHLDAGFTKFIIDCRYMGFISSVGIGALVALKARLARKGGTVKLAAIQGTVMQILRLVRIDKLLDIYGDLEFARQSFYEPATDPQAESV